MKRATEKTEQFSSSSQPSIIFEWLAALDLICLFTLHFAHVHDFQRQARSTKKSARSSQPGKGFLTSLILHSIVHSILSLSDQAKEI